MTGAALSGSVHPQPGVPHLLAAHNVRLHQTGRKRLHHLVVGDLELTDEVLVLPLTRCRWWCTAPSPVRLPGRSKPWPAGAATLDQPAAVQAPEEA